MHELVSLSVRGPAGTRETARVVKVVAQGDTLHLCGRESCPHWGGQKGLFAGAELMGCRLTGADPVTLCQPFYTEAAEDHDAARRAIQTRLESDQAGLRTELLRQLDDAEVWERRLVQVAEEVGLW